jgi:hypothetical protein
LLGYQYSVDRDSGVSNNFAFKRFWSRILHVLFAIKDKIPEWLDREEKLEYTVEVACVTDVAKSNRPGLQRVVVVSRFREVRMFWFVVEPLGLVLQDEGMCFLILLPVTWFYEEESRVQNG